MAEKKFRIVIITGLSGSGKSTALKVLEDVGFYCVDNLPPVLLPKFIELCEGYTWQKITKIALGMDIRERAFLKEYPHIIEQLRSEGYQPEVIFLESSNEVLVRRFSETRRQHPLSEATSVLEGIRMERELLADVKRTASLIFDTSPYTVHELQRTIFAQFQVGTTKSRLTIYLISFGYRFGIPYDADLVLDVRFLPNPYFVDHLRPMSGNDEAVKAFLLQKEETTLFLEKLEGLLTFLLPLYENEGKANLTIAVGCTGGRHRSVSVVNCLAGLIDQGVYFLHVRHRDVDKL